MSYRLRSRFAHVVLSGLCTAFASGQSVVQPGTVLTIGAGTTVTLADGVVLATAPGAALVNDGTVLLAPQASLNEAAGAPIQGLGRERIVRSYSSNLSNAEPGGLRLRVSTSQAPGTVVLERGHTAVLEPGGATSIARWYDWSSSVNIGLDASVAFGYDPVQLNGINENDQVLHVLQSNTFWQAIPSGVDPVNKQVTAVGLDSLGTFTTFGGALTTGTGQGQALELPLLFPTVSETEVQACLPEGMVPVQWSAVDASGRTLPIPAVQRSPRWFTLHVEPLSSGSYVVLINGRPAGRIIRP